MAFEGLADKLQGVFKKLKGKGVLTESDINEAMREVKLALLEADVNFKVVKEFVASVKEKSLGTDVLESDVYRPAAIDQLEIVGKSVGVPVYTDRDSQVPEEIAKKAVKEAEYKGFDVLIIDTAGRLHIDEALMEELVRIKQGTKPHEILLVVDAMTGQDAVNAADAFNQKLGIDGIVMTKLDGDTRGGAALSAKSVTGKPIKFMGVGEKLDALEPFHPERMASRILGMGDMLTLIEKAQESFDEKQAAEMERKLRKNEFTLEDFLEQFSQVRKMGGFGKILDMLPGMGGKVSEDQMSEGEKEMKYMEAIIFSMTPQERRDPSILNASRRKRIAAGAGVTVNRVNTLVKRYEETRKMMKQLNGGKFKKNRLFRGL